LSASGSSEAKPLITEHREAVLPIAEALMVHHTLDAEQIDTIIAAAPERARRIDWNGGAARIVAHDVERVFADIDADHGDRGIGCLTHGVLLVFGAPLPASLAGGAGARPDHPITGRRPEQTFIDDGNHAARHRLSRQQRSGFE
jgi:hypothetical protein